MSIDGLVTLFKVGGLTLVLIGCIYLLLRFSVNRFVKTLDDVAKRSEQHAIQITAATTTAMREIANSVTQSSAATVQAITLLTDRVSRMEGVVAGLGLAAVQHARDAREWDDEGPTPVERPPASPNRVLQIPAPRGQYTQHARPPTERGKEKK